MDSFLSAVIAFFKADAISVWSKVQGAFNVVINEIPDDEIQIAHDTMDRFTAGLAAGKTWGEAAADVWTFVENQEGKEIGKVTNLLIQAFLAKFEPHA